MRSMALPVRAASSTLNHAVLQLWLSRACLRSLKRAVLQLWHSRACLRSLKHAVLQLWLSSACLRSQYVVLLSWARSRLPLAWSPLKSRRIYLPNKGSSAHMHIENVLPPDLFAPIFP